MSLPADKQRSQLLGMKLDWLMKRAGLSQGHLEKLIDVRLGQLFMAGTITVEQMKHSGTSQTTISRICKGIIAPSREVLELLALGLQDWYEGDDYHKLVERARLDFPDFVPPQLTEEDISDLFHLAGLATPAEMEASLTRALALTQIKRDSPLAKQVEARNEALRRKMDGNASSSQMRLLSVFIPLPFMPSIWHSLGALATGLLGLLWLHQHSLHMAVQGMHAGFK